MFPNELKNLTPVEEKLIAMNSCYRFATRYSHPEQPEADRKVPEAYQAPHYEEIHISWQGAEKPAPSDLSGLLSVRRRVVERALLWLRKYNPHYAEIEINRAEMESWGAVGDV
ncbi:hypothetical protein FOCG_01823 [Fusarium oxysporum f. sp. radicis-lycopersici 26381]|nr:hypothetical protein FOCG_01823 [Fusarium oxysporum f. sp. radicis-lycopersici 26381]